MTSLHSTERTAPTVRPRAAPATIHPGSLAAQGLLLLALAGVAGVALGVVDLVLQLHLAYPWADLANSSAVWAVAAFVFAFAATRHPVVGAATGVVVLTVAVEAYYVAAMLTD